MLDESVSPPFNLLEYTSQISFFQDLFFKFLAPPGLSQAPINHDVNQTEKRTSPDTDTDVEDDGYTLTAYGDISLSNVLFVPGLPTALSPERHTRRESRDSHYRDNNNVGARFTG